MRASFPHADLLPGELVCFNVGGNKCRILTKVVYRSDNSAEVYVRMVLTHKEYDKL